MTEKHYQFKKNARIIGIILGVGYLVFMAGALFNGFKPDFADYAIFVIVLLNVINTAINKPIPPSSSNEVT